MATKYPIGIQSFETIISDGYAYVDKTEYIHNLAALGKYFFLSRPRRFGKSLLLSTIKAFYEGKKELFNGLAISRYEHDWHPHPVLHIALNAYEYNTPDSLLEKFGYDFDRWETLYGVDQRVASYAERFRRIIEQAYAITGQKVVILIDEYDKPLLDTATIGNLSRHADRCVAIRQAQHIQRSEQSERYIAPSGFQCYMRHHS